MDAKGFVYVQKFLTGVSVFDDSSNLVAELRTPRAVDPRHWFVTDRGTIYLVLVDYANPTTPDTRTRAVVRVHPDGLGLDTLGTEPSQIGAPLRAPYMMNGFRVGYSVPLSPRFHEDFGARGTWAFGFSATYAIHVRDIEGRLMRIESDAPPVEAKPAEREWLAAEATASIRRDDPRAAIDASLVPSAKPYYKGLRHDTDGRMWVELYQPGAVVEVLRCPRSTSNAFGAGGQVQSETCGNGTAPHRATEWTEPVVYDVFAPTGELMGRVAIPPRKALMAARGSFVWLQELDALDVPSLVRYRLVF